MGEKTLRVVLTAAGQALSVFAVAGTFLSRLAAVSVMKAKNVCLAVPALLFCVSAVCAQPSLNTQTGQPAQPSAADAQHIGAPLLTYNEIVQLYQQDSPPVGLRDKLNRLLTTPFVNNGAAASGVRPLKPSSPQTGKFLRVAEWNIERGLEFDAVRLAFTDAQGFSRLMDQKNSKATADERAHILDEVQVLKQADLLVLNEVDWGMNRTLFRNVAADLADALGMNYAYGVEFVEVDPITIGINQQVVLREVERAYAEPAERRKEMMDHVRQVMRPDPERYRGLHGTAILSRYPLLNVRLIPFGF